MTAKERIITVRRAADRGRAEHGWLHARFTFSFAEYHDPAHMNFHSLRVMNNDTLEPGGGFPTHPHRDAEIFTYVISGQLSHEDSMGNAATIEAGNLQYMSAGSGVRHSEFNPSDTQSTELYQVWILPDQRGGEPRYAEKPLGARAIPNALTLLFSGDGHDASTAVRQNVDIYFGKLSTETRLEIPASETAPHVWIQVISGKIDTLENHLGRADGLAIENCPETISLHASEESELLVFRLGTFD
jgi:redox-sensitive bicupin YhaK (pirin superfamily)